MILNDMDVIGPEMLGAFPKGSRVADKLVDGTTAKSLVAVEG